MFAAFSVSAVSAVSRLLLDCGRDANMDMVRETIAGRIRKASVCMRGKIVIVARIAARKAARKFRRYQVDEMCSTFASLRRWQTLPLYPRRLPSEIPSLSLLERNDRWSKQPIQSKVQ
jgi:hypothetical protein